MDEDKSGSQEKRKEVVTLEKMYKKVKERRFKI